MTAALAARPAGADDRVAQARRHFQAAEAAEKKGDFTTALREYRAAYAAKPHPAVLYNIGAVYERLGDGEEAARAYTRYLAERPDATDRREIEAHLLELRRRPSPLQVGSQPPGAQVELDGEPRCQTPCSLTATAGEHEIGVTLAGREAQRRRVVAQYGKPLAETFTLPVRSARLVLRAGTASGATVAVDGVVRGQAPLAIDLPAGRHRLAIERDGYAPLVREIDLAPGDLVDLPLTLVPLGAEPPPAPGLGAAEPASGAAGSPSAVAAPGVPLVRAPSPLGPDGPGLARSAPPRPPEAHLLLGALGGANALRESSSWGGGPVIGVQSAGGGADLELAVLLPVPTFQLDVRWYLSQTAVRPFMLSGMAVVVESAKSAGTGGGGSTSSSTSGAFYTLNFGVGLSFDLGPVALYLEGLVNYALLESTTAGPGPDRLSVPLLAGMYLRL